MKIFCSERGRRKRDWRINRQIQRSRSKPIHNKTWTTNVLVTPQNRMEKCSFQQENRHKIHGKTDIQKLEVHHTHLYSKSKHFIIPHHRVHTNIQISTICPSPLDSVHWLSLGNYGTGCMQTWRYKIVRQCGPKYLSSSQLYFWN